jgi:hypothetical protein
MSDLEARYRRALRWYPKRWRATNEDAVVGTLLDAADDDRRSIPARGELADLRLNALGVRTAFIARFYPSDVRNLASAMCLGLGTTISISAITHIAVDAWNLETAGERLTIFSPFASVNILFFLLWIAAFICALVGLRRVTRVLLIATLPTAVAVWVFDNYVPQLLWMPSTALATFALLAVLAAIGTPSTLRRHRTALSVSLGASVLATAIVGLQLVLSSLAQFPQFGVEYLLGGGPAMGFAGSNQQIVLWDPHALIRPYETWFGYAIPLVVISAGILNRLKRQTLAGALLVLIVPMGATLLSAGSSTTRILTTWSLVVLGAAVVFTVVALLRLFGLRISITRV